MATQAAAPARAAVRGSTPAPAATRPDATRPAATRPDATRPDASRARRATVLVGAAGGWAGLSVALGWATSGSLARVEAAGPATVDDLVALLAGLGAWLALSWLALGVLLTAAASTPGRVDRALDLMARRITPGVVRRAATGLLGAAVVGGPLAAPAGALAGQVAPAAPPAVTALTALDRPTVAPGGWTPDRQAPGGRTPDRQAPGGWTPDRPAAPARLQSAAAEARLVTSPAHRIRGGVAQVVIRSGDTLWDIAGRALGPGAGPAEIAAEWPRWYAANRDVIGPDPSLIHPGRVLRAPAAE